jgi:hypothetical protein
VVDAKGVEGVEGAGPAVASDPAVVSDGAASTRFEK